MTAQPSRAHIPDLTRLTPRKVLESARGQDRAGHLDLALTTYAGAIRLAESVREPTVLIEALRRLAVLHHRRNDADKADELCRRSFALADETGDQVQAGEALNTLGGFNLEAGEVAAARRHYQDALVRAGRSGGLRGRAEQNLGILASIRGEFAEANAHYWRSLEAFESSGDWPGVALAWHNLGLCARAEGQLDVASDRLAKSEELATTAGDVHLVALCRLGHAGVFYARQHYEDAKDLVEAALVTLERLDLPMERSAAHRLMGMIFRESGRPRDAAHQFRTAVRLAVETRWLLGEAEALRELARLNRESGHRAEALTLLTVAHGLFTHVEARIQVADVARAMEELTA